MRNFPPFSSQSCPALIGLVLGLLAAACAVDDAPEERADRYRPPAGEQPVATNSPAALFAGTGLAKFRFEVSPGQPLVAVRTQRSVSSAGASWTGVLQGDPTVSVVFTQVGTSIVGSLRYQGNYLTVTSDSVTGETRIQKTATNSLQGAEPIALPDSSGDALVPLKSADHTIDIGIVATNDAVGYYGNENALRAAMANEIALFNKIMVDSESPARFRLAGVIVPGYNQDPASQSADLDRLRIPNDGVMDGIHDWRDQIGADVVHLVRRDGAESCGVAYLAHDGNDQATFGVSAIECFYKYTLQHEIGHNLGFMHAPEDGGVGQGARPYSHGLKSPSGKFRTLMAYDCPDTDCPRLPRLSNAKHTYDGVAMGTEQQDNRDSSQETWSRVSTVRPAVLGAGFRVESDNDDSTFCSGRYLQLSATAIAGASYRWQINDEEVSDQVSFDWRAESEGLYTVTLEVSDGQATQVASLDMELMRGPALVTQSRGLCAGDSIDLEVAHADAVAWSPANAVADPIASITTASPAESTTFSVAMRNQFGCSNEDAAAIEVVDRPTAPTIQGPSVVHRSTTAQYRALSPHKIAWTVLGGTIVEDHGDTVLVQWHGDGESEISAEAYEVEGCASPFKMAVEVSTGDVEGGCSTSSGENGRWAWIFLAIMLARVRRRLPKSAH